MVEIDISVPNFCTKILKSRENIEAFEDWLATPDGKAARFVWQKADKVTLNEDFVLQYTYLCTPISEGGAGLLTPDVLDRLNAEIKKQTPSIPEPPAFVMSVYGATLKILKIKVFIDANGKMSYPEGFFGMRYLEHLYLDEPNGTCWMVILIEGNELAKITDLTNVTEITLDEARLFVAPYDKKITKIADEGMIRAIEIKSRIGIALTDAEKAAIDPNNSTLGINYQQTFIEKLEQRISA